MLQQRNLITRDHTAELKVWNDTINGSAVYQLDRTLYAIARERRNDYLHAVMNTANRPEF